MKRRVMTNLAAQNSTAAVELVERNESPLGIALLNPHAVGRRSPEDLVELAREITQADTFVRANATSKLEVIAEQIKFLQKQAYSILKEAKDSKDLHHAACNFHKIPGKIYFLYRRASGQKYFSMLSPDDWSGAPPHEFLGSFRLEHDMTWTPSERMEEKSKNLCLINKMMELQDFHSLDSYKPSLTGESPMDCIDG